MSEEYFTVAYITGNEVILHGCRADKSIVRITLTDEQVVSLDELLSKQDAAEQAFLRGLVDEKMGA